jgi:DNA polymerase III delta prime subunit
MTTPLIENIRQAADLAKVIVVAGDRQHDRFIYYDADGTPRPAQLESILRAAVPGVSAVGRYDPATGQLQMPERQPQAVKPEDLVTAFRQQAMPLLLVVAEYLFEDAEHPRDGDMRLLRALEHHARTETGDRRIVLVVPNTRVLPLSLSSSPAVRVVNLPPAALDERMAYARLRCARLAGSSGIARDALAEQLSRVSDGMSLTNLEMLIRALDVPGKVVAATDIEPTARALRVGFHSSPWSGNVLRQAIREAPARLEKRVRGQPQVIGAVSAALRKAAAGLAGAHQGELSRGPRATLFLAGPTGTGKTETAKALAELVFGDEAAILRIDCAEFRHDHTVSRLIGAPPGYVGYETGGELTERVRKRPHSVILFDEIEKAHPRLLDIFLSILDDGRLTDGQGVCTRFDESILVFTSNLGIYAEKDNGMGGTVRQPRFTLDNSIEEITREVRAAVRETFVSHMGRPELFGRMGGMEAVIVYDFLRDLKGVTDKFLSRIRAATERLHGVRVEIAPAVTAALAERASSPETLVLGARGLAQVIETHFSAPLADIICERDVLPAKLTAGWDGRRVNFR